MTVDLHEHSPEEPGGLPGDERAGAMAGGARVRVGGIGEPDWQALDDEDLDGWRWAEVDRSRVDPLAGLDWFPTPDQVPAHLPRGPWDDDGGHLPDLSDPITAAAWAATDPLASVWAPTTTTTTTTAGSDAATTTTTTPGTASRPLASGRAADVPVLLSGPVLPDRLVDVLAGLAPGPALARVIADADLSVVDDAGLVEYVDAVTREEAWMHARKAAAAAELSRRESMNPMWSPAAGDPPAQACIAGDELAMRLACSRRSATRLVAHGRAYDGVLSATGDALATGGLDVARAQIITDRLTGLPAVTVLDVQARVLPDAPRRTPTQLRRDLERALITVDTAQAEHRRAHAVTTRRVEHPRVLPDGMAGLWAVLPAGDAARIDTTLDAAARTARAAGDPRTLDQLRADGLRDLLLHTTCNGTGSSTFGTTTIDASSTPATSSANGESTGTHQADPDGPGAAANDTPPTTTPATAPADGSAADTAAAAAPGDHGQCGCSRARASRRTQVRVTVPLSTLLGVDDAPGDLAGYGPIDATTARALAEGGIWRRLITDPTSGTVLDVGRTTYRPPAGLVEHVQARDQVCARPGCTTPAEACDLDHTLEYHPPPRVRHANRPGTPPGAPPGTPPGTPGGTRTSRADPGTPGGTGTPGADPHAPARPLGTTSAANLGPLCRRDHRLKTDGGMRLVQIEPGIFEWTTTTGHRYRVIPGDNGNNHHLGYGPPPF